MYKEITAWTFSIATSQRKIIRYLQRGRLLQEQNPFSIKCIFEFLSLRHREEAVDRWLDIGSLLTLNTLALPFQLNMAGVIVFSKD